MALNVWNMPWLVHNSQRNYPLAQDATRLDLTGTFEIPQSFIVDLYLQVPVSADVEPAKFFIRNVGAYTTGFSVVVGYESTSGPINVASALVPRQGFTKNSVYRLGGIGDFEDAVGTLVIGSLTEIDQQPVGFFEFDLSTGRLEAEPVRPQIRGVGALIAVNGADRSSRLQRDIELIAGSNARIRAIPATTNRNARIVFDFIEGEGSVEDCVCEDSSTGDALGPAIRTINGIGPGLDGDFSMLGNTCLEIEGITNGLQLDDVCSQPCCGCVELERITEDLEEVERENRSLSTFLSNLQASVTQTDQVILASRLTDRGCFSDA